ncbi:hypothetical protein ACRALDRAFT_2037966 [Sodiomyces alcalophilus JCM 7366]|uniref:uncharacterized protein n=1 Tax=Sodiomyces alcalophilus JCM 7366 TaxID=591952 RepID=UPI0039B49002
MTRINDANMNLRLHIESLVSPSAQAMGKRETPETITKEKKELVMMLQELPRF